MLDFGPLDLISKLDAFVGMSHESVDCCCKRLQLESTSLLVAVSTAVGNCHVQVSVGSCECLFVEVVAVYGIA